MTRFLAGLVLVLVGVAHATPNKLLFPGIAGALSNKASVASANSLYCVTAPAEYDLTNATKLAGFITSNTGGNVAGFGLYTNSDANTPTALATVSGSAVVGSLSANGLGAFSVTGGTLYRICVCANVANTVSYLGVDQAASCCEYQNLTTLIQALHPTYVGTATTTCTNGSPPDHTGPITADTTSPSYSKPRVPFLLIEK